MEVSIVIPTRNRWPLLRANALPSALAQEDVDFEVVVVDDASTDETPARLAELDDPRLRVLTNERPLRLPGARNAGISIARGEWLAFLDDDDLWSPRKLRAQLGAAASARADWVYGKALVVDEHRRVLEADPFPDPAELPTLLLQGNWIPGGGSNVIVRSRLVQRVGGFDETLRFFEDWDLWLRLLPAGLPAACPELVMARVEHRRNMVLRDRSQVLPALERLLGKHKTVDREDRLSVAQWLAWEQFRSGKRLSAAALYLRAALAYRSLGNLPPAAGALLGEPGMRAASRLLRVLGGASHIEAPEQTPPEAPEWLERHAAAEA